MRRLVKALFEPALIKNGLFELSAAELRSLGARALAVDADNTSCYDGTSRPLPGAAERIEEMKESGLPVLLLTNAEGKRAGRLASLFGIPFVSLALKPLPFGYIRAARRLGVSRKELCFAGDQLFTDILGAKLSGCSCVYIRPYAKEQRNAGSYERRRRAEARLFAYMAGQKARGDEEK